MSASSPPLRVSVMRSGSTAVLRLEGELDYATAPDLAQHLAEVVRGAPPKQIVVEAEGIAFADVAGLDPLIRLAQEFGPGVVRVRKPPRPLARVIRLLDMADLLGLDR